MSEIETTLQSIRKIAEAEIPKYKSKKYYNSIPKELFQILAKQGVSGLSVDQKYFGCKHSTLLTARVMEELGRVDSGVAIFTSVHLMVSGIINNFGNENQKKEILTKLASGEILGAFALTEPQAGSDAASIKTRAKKDGNSWILNGEKCYITSAGFADLYLVFAINEKLPDKPGKDKMLAFLIDANLEGLNISKPERKMGAELSPIASMTFNNVKVSEKSLLGQENKGYKIALSGLAGGRINIAAIACGISDSAITKATEYLKERKQFGKTIENFQGLQFILADMATKNEASRQLYFLAANTLDKSPKSKLNKLYPSYTKCFATDSCMEITTNAVQLLGGAGYIKEYGVEELMRAAKMLQIVEGTNQIQKNIIAKELLR